MNTVNTYATPSLTDSEPTSASDTLAEPSPSVGTRAWISQLVANMNRMAVDEDFRKEIEKKIF